MRPEDYDEELSAFHECAHAVVSILCHVHVLKVVLYGEDNGSIKYGECIVESNLLQHMTGECLPGILAGPIVDMEWNMEWSGGGSKFEDIEQIYTFAEGTDMYLARESAGHMYDLSLRRVLNLATGELVATPPAHSKDIGVRKILESAVDDIYKNCVMPNWDMIGKVSDRLLKSRKLTGKQVQRIMIDYLKKEKRLAA
jgi:hypothetical protein